TSRDLGETVLRIMPKLAADMPSGNVVMQAWNNHAEIIVCSSRNEICQVSDSFASEHLQVIAKDLDWWRRNLKNYGSLFLGEGSSVTHGDKCSGTNHILPTKRAARYTGGLNVMKFLKVLTWQQLSRDANLPFSGTGSRISRLEGMDGHARSCDWRLRKYFPDQDWDFEVAEQKRYD
ncbi:MAG TPA: histidinol dehydrogenase, partial [Pseudomonadales bacterium]|nr:histidinol dehydrogenase [Pseudomonadales bacterium]